MRVVAADELDAALGWPELIAALAQAFAGGIVAPTRHHHAVERPGGDGTLLLMPAWTAAGGAETRGSGPASFAGVKVVTVFPANAERGLPSVQGTYLLMDGATGEPLAALDGARLTLWRTAAASALAMGRLARPDAARLLVVGTGALAPFLARAHASVRALADVAVWGRDGAKAAALAARLAAEGLPARPAPDLEAAVREADVISCATLSREPLVRGAWLRAGAHLDLVGAFTLAMREADDEALRRSAIVVDTPAALDEGGDVAAALRSGALDRAAVRGDLAALLAGRVPGRERPDDVTLFKSVGASLEDLAAATLAWRRLA